MEVLPVCPSTNLLLKERTAAFFRHLHGILETLPTGSFVAEYQARSCLTGRRVTVLRGGEARRALALAVDDKCRLLVRYEDGTEEALFSGEVSVRPEERSGL